MNNEKRERDFRKEHELRGENRKPVSVFKQREAGDSNVQTTASKWNEYRSEHQRRNLWTKSKRFCVKDEHSVERSVGNGILVGAVVSNGVFKSGRIRQYPKRLRRDRKDIDRNRENKQG